MPNQISQINVASVDELLSRLLSDRNEKEYIEMSELLYSTN